jgi:hypothetical protein
VGASGAILGLAVALAILWPDAEMLVIPIPIPMKARTFAILLVAFNAIMALPFLRGNSSIAYEAHLGGALFGYLFFRPAVHSAREQHAPSPGPAPGHGAARRRRGERSRRVPRPRLRPRRCRPAAVRSTRWPAKWTACWTRSARGHPEPHARRTAFLDDIARQKRPATALNCVNGEQ